MTAIYRIPPAFYDDHVSRDLPAGEKISRTAKSVTVRLTDAERDEILSDARHYADSGNGYMADYPGLVSSARATIRAIERQLDTPS